MTDVRQNSAILVIPESLEGRFFVRNSARELIVELYKPRGRKMELGVEPGAYEVRIEEQRSSRVTKTQVSEGATATLDARQFGPVATEATRSRGDGEAGKYDVARRNRIELRTGTVLVGVAGIGDDRDRLGVLDVFVGLPFARY